MKGYRTKKKKEKKRERKEVKTVKTERIICRKKNKNLYKISMYAEKRKNVVTVSGRI